MSKSKNIIPMVTQAPVPSRKELFNTFLDTHQADVEKVFKRMVEIASGTIKTATPKDSIQAARIIFDRYLGPLPAINTATQVNIEQPNNPLSTLSTSQILSLLEHLKENKDLANTTVTIQALPDDSSRPTDK